METRTKYQLPSVAPIPGIKFDVEKLRQEVARLNEEGKVITKGQQIQIGGNESYISLCRLHWCEEIENANISDYQS